MYLSSSERIIGDILGRGDQFPYIFGVVAIMFGITALLNGKFVVVHGIKKLLSSLQHFVFFSCILLVATLVEGGNPGFWVFIPLLAIVLSTFMFIMPNLNSAALFPMGDIAGTAGAFTSAIRMSIGAAIGGVFNVLIDESLTPFAVGVVAMMSLLLSPYRSVGIPSPMLTTWRVDQKFAGGSVHGSCRVPFFASLIAFHTLSGVHGMSR